MLQVAPLRDVKVTSPYGLRDLDGDGVETLHKGTDFRAPIGTPLFAMGAGVVRAAGDGIGGPGGGFAVDIVDDDDGRLVYLHMSPDLRVRSGERVVAGQLLGFSGGTGAITGPHLHLQWQPNFPTSTDTADIGPIVARLAGGGAGGGGGGLLLALGFFGLLRWLMRKKKR